MPLLRLTFIIVVISGCLRPLSWNSVYKRAIYNIYRLYTISMLYAFTLMQFIDIVLSVDNLNDLLFANNLNILLTIFSSCYKILLMWLSNDNTASLINNLTKEPFKPLDANEMEIRWKFDKMIRNNTFCYILMVEMTCSLMALISLLTDFRHKKLTYQEWVPYDYSSYIAYCFTFAQQIISTFHAATINVACDILICALLMHVCCQIEILEYRLKNISTNRYTVGYCVRHHNQIFEYAHLVNVRFSHIIGYQFIVSVLLICTNLYQLTKFTFGSDNAQFLTYAAGGACILTEIFIYCWFGNKVKVKSLQLIDHIFQMEWLTLNNNVKRSLLIIMRRSLVPIEVTTAHILTLNLNSFVELLKIAYSAYNLMIRV